ncbi:putative lipoprotein LpqT [Mycobacterium parmense]|uniref:Putative lipoprotein LpqT n=1 Tax=Mycobacterium parmense TaxID=185642 RepID=A0A7I7Z3Q3_9MYCO|nr:LpqN/LpqT family lipoprotein [Mycobacterium parmense]BBZ48227.1 putative lipoprotein LpqT [Mycobacterium parmense]
MVVLATAALTLSAVACGPTSPDYQSILARNSTPSATTTRVDKPVPLSQYLQSIGVTGQQVAPKDLTDLTVSIPTPPDWTRFTNPNIPPETVMISKGAKYPTARLVVFKLMGNFDPAQVIKHGNDDAQLFENFKQLDASTADFNGFPSSMIQGSYDLDGTRLHSWNRIVIATGSPPAGQRYLVQLTVTSLATQAVAQSTDIEAIIHGFVVAAK